MENTIENRDAKIKDWIIKTFWYNKINLLLLGIIIIALAIRVFFFIQTTSIGQTSWWDSAEYLAQGTHYATGIPYVENPQRPPAFQYLIALAILLGLNETWIIFLLSLLPSVIIVFLVFLLGKTMINTRVGLIASAFVATSWNFIFWSNRAQPDFLTLMFQLLTIYYFWNMLKLQKIEDMNKKKIKYSILAGIFSAAGFYFKISALLIPISLLVFLLLKDKLKIFVKKEYWIYAISFLAGLVPYFIWAYYKFGSILAFTTGYSNAIIGRMPFAFHTITFFQVFGLGVMFLIFLAGLLLCLKALMYLDILVKTDELDIRMFLLTLMIIVISFYTFYIRAIEDRWIFILLPIMAIICGMILDKVYSWISEYGNWKWIIVIIICGLLCWSSVEQFNYSETIITGKMKSYSDVKLAAEWMRDNSLPTEIIMSISYPQTIFYSQRHVETYSSMSWLEFMEYVNENKPRYITFSNWEPYQPPWRNYLIYNTSLIIPVKEYIPTIENGQRYVVIFQFVN